MANGKIKVDQAQMEDLITRLTDVQQSYLHFMQLTNKGVGYLINSLDPVLQCNISGKIDTVLSVSSDYLERLTAAIASLRACKESFESVDAYLAREYSDWMSEEIRKSYSQNDYNNQYSQNYYNYQSEDFYVLNNFEQVATVQKLSSNCTSTAWCMGLSILTGKEYDATKEPFWDGQAHYKGFKDAFLTDNIWQRSYDELMAGKPVWFKSYNGNKISGDHAVIIVGVVENNKDLDAGSFLVIDPSDGAIKKLSEVKSSPPLFR